MFHIYRNKPYILLYFIQIHSTKLEKLNNISLMQQVQIVLANNPRILLPIMTERNLHRMHCNSSPKDLEYVIRERFHILFSP